MKKIVLLLLAMAVPGTCHAVEEVGSMKCKKGTVKAGVTKATVVARCGKPTSKNPTPKQPLSMGTGEFSATEEWSYKTDRQEYIVLINGETVVRLFKEQRK